MKKPRLVYAGHSHHVKTGSTVFLIKLLESRFDVVRMADESWLPDRPPLAAATINAAQPEVVVFFQLILSRRELRQLQCRHVIWVPMHDNIRYRSSRYRRYAGGHLKSLHFSATTRAFFAQLGYETHLTQFFPPPAAPVERSVPAPGLFFWIRRRELSWPTLKALLGDFRPARIVLRHASDPGYEAPILPSPEDMREYRVELHEGWLEPVRYRELMASCQLFMAPRVAEGIGQAMLEAMAASQAVIAPNAPTMNEYVRHGENGYLYDPQQPAPLDFSRWRELAERAHRDVAEGHQRWLQAQAGLLEYVARPPARRESLLWRLYRGLGV